MTDPEFQDAFRQHKDVLYRFAFRMTGSGPTAEDVVQECFLALWSKPENYDSQRGALRAFLLGVARNLVFKGWRDKHEHDSLDDDALICPPFDLAGKERSDAVAQAVQLLPPLQRETLILAEYEEMSLAEISITTGAELPAVKSRLNRARANLRRMLSPLLNSKGVLYGTK
jgi:RNA polymerase sigma-70 factor (ECF subfamily)